MSVDIARVLDRHGARLRRIESAPPPRTSQRYDVRWSDDFIAGNLTSGTIGEKGWTLVGGALTDLSPAGSRPGGKKLSSTTVINTLAYLHVGGMTTIGILDPALTFDLSMFVKIEAPLDTNGTWRMGLQRSPEADPGDYGMYIERLNTDTNWFGVVRSSAAQTRFDLGVAPNTTDWTILRIRRVRSTEIGFSIDGGTEYSMDSAAGTNTATHHYGVTTIPTATLVISIMVRNHAALARSMDVDLVELFLQGLTR